MARPKITFQNKIENGGVTEQGRVSAANINEIKSVVNANIDETYDKQQVNDLIDQAVLFAQTTIKGSIVPSSPAPESGDGSWFASQAGTYTNYGGIVVPANTFAVISRIGSTWSSSMTDLNPDFDKLDDVVSALDYFVNGYQKTFLTEEFTPQTGGYESGIILVTNEIRASASYISKRNYILGDAMFADVSISAGSTGTNDAFFLGIKEDNSIDIIVPRASGYYVKTLDLMAYKSVSFTLAASSAFPNFIKFYKGDTLLSKNNVKKYIDDVKDQLDGIVSDPINIETLIDSSFIGSNKLANTVMKADGTTTASTGITTIFKLDIKKHSILEFSAMALGAGGGVNKNAVIVAYKEYGIAVDLFPLIESGGYPINETYNVDEYDYISFSYGNTNAEYFKVKLLEIHNEPQQVKKYIDLSVAKSAGMSLPNSKFTLTRMGQIFSVAQSGLVTIYWPWIIETSNIASPLGKYYMYFSTDHNGSNGSISMAYSDVLTSWTLYGKVLRAIDQLGVAAESETPSVVWDSHAQEFRMYWQTRPDPSGLGYAQSTQISRSTNGINWEYIKTALDIPIASITGDGHNGYFTPRQVNNMYIATHLMGGTDQSYNSISYSYDGLNWLTSCNPLEGQLHGVFAPDVYPGSANSSAVFLYNGRFYSVCQIGVQASGTNPKNTNLGITELCDDFTIKGKAELLLNMDGVNENTNIRSIGYFQDTDGSMYIIYNCNDRFFLSKLEINF